MSHTRDLARFRRLAAGQWAIKICAMESAPSSTSAGDARPRMRERFDGIEF
jgi:hypothetical protein